MNILIIDDVTYNLKHLENILKHEGHQVRLANNSFAALEELSENRRFDVVICDLVMPEIDGIELIRQAKNLKPYRNFGINLLPKFVLLTASHDNKLLEEATKAGYLCIIKKPASAESIRQTLSDLSSGKIGKEKPEEEMQVLLVEGMEPDIKLLEHLYAISHGNENQIKVASNTEQAKEILKKNLNIKAIICHFTMKDGNAIDFMQQCKNIERYDDNGSIPLPPVVLIIDFVDQKVLSVAKQIGFHEVLIRPIKKEVLEEKLARIYYGSASREILAPKLLIVDDVGYNCVLIEKIIKSHNLDINIITSSNGHDALQMIEKDNRITAVITDLVMPEMNGLELQEKAVELRKTLPNHNHDLPFILITSAHQEKLEENALKKGFHCVFKKPVNSSQLIEKIKSAMNLDQGSSFAIDSKLATSSIQV